MTTKAEFLSTMISGLESLIADDSELDSTELVIVSTIKHCFCLWQQKERATSEVNAFIESHAVFARHKRMNSDDKDSDGDEEIEDLGTCCGCGCEPSTDNPVRNFLGLPLETPFHGTGWGNALLGLPQNGAMTIMCDRCVEQKANPSFYIYGFAVDKQRRPVSELTIPFGGNYV